MPDMREGIYLGFDFGIKNIGVATGQSLTGHANPLPPLLAKAGVPAWEQVDKLIKQWKPLALIVGRPVAIDDKALYTTKASEKFAKSLEERYALPVHLVDERLSTKEARSRLFATGGFRKIQNSSVDGMAACIILEQWLQHPE